MQIPKGVNTGIAMQFLSSDIGQKWKEKQCYDEIYSCLGKFTATLDSYEIPQPEPIVKGVKFILEHFSKDKECKQ